MIQEIIVLGSTGSIGTQTLDVARNLGIKVCGLSAYNNIELLEAQARKFRPAQVAVADEEKAVILKKRLHDTGIEVLGGMAGLVELVSMSSGDTVVTSVVGVSGLIPTLEAIRNRKNIALANKETLVTAGKLVMEEARKKGVRIIPVDSEHSAIFQCLMGNHDAKGIKKLILTASGGPFRGKKPEDLKKVTKAQALKHPNWTMGSKITIDSATLMNKGLEVIEAKWLFGIEADDIQVVVHPQSIIHSMVEFVDGSVMAQLGSPDMRIPIQFALTWPERRSNQFAKLDLLTSSMLTFEEPDLNTFSCLRLAFEALEKGGSMPVVLNAANEVAVSLFLDDRIGFTDIPELVEEVMKKHYVIESPGLEDILRIDGWAREETGELVGGK